MTRVDVQGAGSTNPAAGSYAGIGTYLYDYYSYSGSGTLGNNDWQNETVETLPDGTQNTVYTNQAGEMLLQDVSTGGSDWYTAYHYNGLGQEDVMAMPSAVASVTANNSSVPNLTITLNSNAGLVYTIAYYSSTDGGISETQAGGVANYLKEERIQPGNGGTLRSIVNGNGILQSNQNYFERTGGGATVYPVARRTAYLSDNDNGSDPQTTTYAYTFFTGATRVQSMTVTQPADTDPNDPSIAPTETTVYDIDGRDIWDKNADGSITYTAYDEATGAVVKTITDVNTADTCDFAGHVLSGWTTPAGGGLELITLYQVDALGRSIKETDPNGSITYTVYNDPLHEVRTYADWNTSTAPATQVTIDDWAHGFSDTLTMAVTPHTTNCMPDGTESIGSLLSLERSHLNSAGQVIAADDYFNLAGLTYGSTGYDNSSTYTLGQADVNFSTTLYGYDAAGNQNLVHQPIAGL